MVINLDWEKLGVIASILAVACALPPIWFYWLDNRTRIKCVVSGGHHFSYPPKYDPEFVDIPYFGITFYVTNHGKKPIYARHIHIHRCRLLLPLARMKDKGMEIGPGDMREYSIKLGVPQDFSVNPSGPFNVEKWERQKEHYNIMLTELIGPDATLAVDMTNGKRVEFKLIATAGKDREHWAKLLQDVHDHYDEFLSRPENDDDSQRKRQPRSDLVKIVRIHPVAAKGPTYGV